MPSGHLACQLRFVLPGAAITYWLQTPSLLTQIWSDAAPLAQFVLFPFPLPTTSVTLDHCIDCWWAFWLLPYCYRPSNRNHSVWVFTVLLTDCCFFSAFVINNGPLGCKHPSTFFSHLCHGLHDPPAIHKLAHHLAHTLLLGPPPLIPHFFPWPTSPPIASQAAHSSNRALTPPTYQGGLCTPHLCVGSSLYVWLSRLSLLAAACHQGSAVCFSNCRFHGLGANHYEVTFTIFV